MIAHHTVTEAADNQPYSQDTTNESSQPPDPDQLAQRIHSLLSTTSLPPASSPSSKSPDSETSSLEYIDDPQPSDKDLGTDHTAGSSLPAGLTADPELISLLSSPEVMNGKTSHDDEPKKPGKAQSIART